MYHLPLAKKKEKEEKNSRISLAKRIKEKEKMPVSNGTWDVCVWDTNTVKKNRRKKIIREKIVRKKNNERGKRMKEEKEVPLRCVIWTWDHYM